MYFVLVIFHLDLNDWSMQLELSSIHSLRATVDHLEGTTVSTLARGAECRSLVFNRSGELVFGSSQHVVLSSRADWNTYMWRGPKDIQFQSEIVYSVAQNSDRVFAAVSDGTIYQITPCQLSNPNHKTTLIRYAYNFDHIPKLCASDAFLVISVGTDKLLIYGIVTTNKHEFVLPNTHTIGSVCFDHDGGLLVLDSVKERVSKYRILKEEHTPDKQW